MAETEQNKHLLKNYYASPRWSWELLDCTMPMTFDTRSNCAFQCSYCFSFFQRGVGKPSEDYKHHRYHLVNVDRVKRLFRGEVPNSTFNWYIKRKLVLQWGGLSDGFDYYELYDGKSLELLQFFVDEVEYPVSISSKNTWLLDGVRGGKYEDKAKPYWEVFKRGAEKGLIHWKSSIITANEDFARQIEPGVGPSRDRFKLLEELSKVGVTTTFRFRPMILGISADYPYTDNSYSQLEALWKTAKDSGCYSVTTEFLCLESRASESAKERFQKIGIVSGIGPGLLQWYADNSMKASGLLRLNYDIKRPYYAAMEELSEKYDLKFFVSDAHGKEKSFHAGCCGLPTSGPLSNGFKGHFAEAILIAKKKGYVRWKDIQSEAEYYKNIPFTHKDGFNVGDTRGYADNMFNTMYEYMLNQWNTPASFSGPNRYFGGALVAAPQRDEDGHVVYMYNREFIENGYKIKNAQELQVQLEVQGIDMQADGGEWGWVAYPVFVDAHDSSDEDTRRLLDACRKHRLEVSVYGSSMELAEKYPEIDFVAGNGTQTAELIYTDSQVSGIQHYWLLSPSATRLLQKEGKPISIRAYLSEQENLFVEHRYAPTNSDCNIISTEAMPEGLLG